MTAYTSEPDLLALHAVRLLGFASDGAAAARFGLDAKDVGELLQDFEAFGWVSRHEFAGSAGWSLTEAGRAENERLLAVELAARGAEEEVVRVHAAFVPLNARFREMATRWQLRPDGGDPMALNDHTDFCGSMRWVSTRATSCGYSCTRTFSPPSASNAARRSSAPQPS